MSNSKIKSNENLQSRLSIDADQLFQIEFIERNKLIKVSMFMDIDEFERDMLSNDIVKHNIAFTEIHKCNADNCNKKYALIVGKYELGKYCYECSSSETGNGYYCNDCYTNNGSFKNIRQIEDWFCYKCI